VSRLRRLLKEVAERDSTFEPRLVRGNRAWVGRCIHCRRAIVVPEDPREPASATLEHIVPRTHGGGDELDNLALACASCNHAKGRKLDARRRDDPVLQRVIEQLRAERDRRKRA
jgi:5-methylcytosine-specific restriction endonuclease McrA